MTNTTISADEAALLPSDKFTYRIVEASDALGIGETTLRRAIKNQLVKTIKVSPRRIVITRLELIRILTEGVEVQNET